jgi:hypothetical protein
MKQLLIIGLLLSCVTCFSQAPQKMSYQLVVRNSSNVLVTNQAVGIKVSILQGSATGTAVFVETQNPTTNANGLASFAIGDGTPVTGSFGGIDWANGPYFIKTEVDPVGGTSYTITGTSQLLSVPYALFAGSTTERGKTHLILSGNLTDAQAAAKIAAEVGPNTKFVWIQYSKTLTTVNISGVTNLIELVIQNNVNLKTVILPALTSVDYKIVINRNDSLSSLSLDALSGAANIDIRRNGLLNSVSFQSLASVALGATIDSNNVLSNVSLPALSILDNLEIMGNDSIQTLSLPALTSGGRILVWQNIKLSTLSIPLLNKAETLSIGYGLLTNVSLPALVEVNGLGVYDVNLSSFSCPVLAKAGNIRIGGVSLTSVSFPVLVVCNFIDISGNSLTSVSCPVLSNVLGVGTLESQVFILSSTSSSAVNFSFPALTNVVGTLAINSPSIGLTNLVFPSLTNISGTLYVQCEVALTNLSFPQLTKVGLDLIVTMGPNPSTMSFPLLDTCGRDISIYRVYGPVEFPKLKIVKKISIISSFTIGNYATLADFPMLDSANSILIQATQVTSVSFASLKRVSGNISIFQNYSLSSINMPSLALIGATNTATSSISFNNNSLPSTNVNQLLNILVNITPQLTHKTIALQQNTSAPPTGQGITDKATLISRGNSVSTN